jgi:RNA polymerase sigma-70 factor (ECF subfamily)
MQVRAQYEAHPDQDLAHRAGTGDEEAFAALYGRHSQRLHDFVLRITRDREAAADVVQATFVKAWEAFSRGGGPENVKAWLYAVAYNGAIDEVRRRKRLAPVESEGALPPFTEIDESRLSDPHAVVHDKELVELVWNSAAALSPQEYSLLDLHLRQGLTADELAAGLGLEKGAVYTRLSRLRDSLEESVASTILMRRGRRDCPDLDALLGELGATELTRESRRAIQAHLQECSRCQESKRRLVSPAEIFGGLAPVPLDPALRDSIWDALSAATRSAAPPEAGPQPGIRDRWRRASRASKALVVAAVVAAVAGAGATGVVLSSGGAPVVRDPSNVHSTSHRIRVASTNPVVAIAWNRAPNASGYSVRWTRAARALPDRTPDLPGTATGTRSAPLSPGAWYFHLRTRGKNGGWTNTVDVGPFLIRAEQAPPAEPARLSRADFVQQADAICARANRKTRRIPQPTDLFGLGEYVDTVLPVAKEELESLRELRPPKELEATVDRMLKRVEQTVKALEKMGVAVKKGDQAAVQSALQQGNRSSQTARQLAQKLELKVCGRSPSTVGASP